MTGLGQERKFRLPCPTVSCSAFAAGGLFLAVGQQTACLQTFVVLSGRTSASAPSKLTLSPQR